MRTMEFEIFLLTIIHLSSLWVEIRMSNVKGFKWAI